MTWGTVMLMIEGKTLRENLIQELNKKYPVHSVLACANHRTLHSNVTVPVHMYKPSYAWLYLSQIFKNKF